MSKPKKAIFFGQNIEEYRVGLIDLHLWNSSRFLPCRRRDYSFRGAGKGDSEIGDGGDAGIKID